MAFGKDGLQPRHPGGGGAPQIVKRPPLDRHRLATLFRRDLQHPGGQMLSPLIEALTGDVPVVVKI